MRVPDGGARSLRTRPFLRNALIFAFSAGADAVAYAGRTTTFVLTGVRE